MDCKRFLIDCDAVFYCILITILVHLFSRIVFAATDFLACLLDSDMARAVTKETEVQLLNFD